MIWLIQTSIDVSGLAKDYGPLGIFAVVFIVLLLGAAKFAKTMLQDTIADARKERDASRQLLKEQAMEFTAHIKRENDEFRTALKDVVDVFERTRPRR